MKGPKVRKRLVVWAGLLAIVGCGEGPGKIAFTSDR